MRIVNLVTGWIAWARARLFGTTFVLRDRRGLRYQIEYGEPFSHLAGVPAWRRELTDDPKMLIYLERVLRPGDFVLDVGASIGVVALLAGKLGCRVLAIEAERMNFEQLCVNIALNELLVEPLQIAITDYSGSGTLNVFPRHRRGHHTLAPCDAAIATQTVQCVTIDELLERLAIERVDLLKIDIEGAEPEAFAGAARSLARGKVRRIIFEISREPLLRTGHEIEDVIRPLRAAGYSIHTFEGEEIVATPAWKLVNLVAVAPGR